jgi:hypothetical protein
MRPTILLFLTAILSGQTPTAAHEQFNSLFRAINTNYYSTDDQLTIVKQMDQVLTDVLQQQVINADLDSMFLSLVDVQKSSLDYYDRGGQPMLNVTETPKGRVMTVATTLSYGSLAIPAASSTIKFFVENGPTWKLQSVVGKEFDGGAIRGMRSLRISGSTDIWVIAWGVPNGNTRGVGSISLYRFDGKQATLVSRLERLLSLGVTKLDGSILEIWQIAPDDWTMSISLRQQYEITTNGLVLSSSERTKDVTGASLKVVDQQIYREQQEALKRARARIE